MSAVKDVAAGLMMGGALPPGKDAQAGAEGDRHGAVLSRASVSATCFSHLRQAAGPLGVARVRQSTDAKTSVHRRAYDRGHRPMRAHRPLSDIARQVRQGTR